VPLAALFSPLNVGIYIHCAAEAELAALFHNGREAYAIHNILVQLGHQQPSTGFFTNNNSTASGIANETF
jgi:hypothetical protein